MNSDLQSAFPIGCAVHVKSAPHGLPGRVRAHGRGKVEVDFPSLHYAARFRPESLIRTSEVLQHGR